MPPGQRVRFHDREHGSTVGEPGEHHEGDPGRIISPTGHDLALLVQRQLLPEEQILSGQLGPRSEAERREPEGINQQPDSGPAYDRRRRAFPHAEACHTWSESASARAGAVVELAPVSSRTEYLRSTRVRDVQLGTELAQNGMKSGSL